MIRQISHPGESDTSTINLSSCLAEQGKKVLLVDIDPQGNATSGVGIIKQNLENTIYELFLEECTISECLTKSAVDNLNVLPSNVNLSGAEIDLIGVEGREFILKETLEKIRDLYEYIIIDCPPSLNVLTVNAMAAADSVIVPIQCEYYALEGLTQLLNTILLTQKVFNEKLTIEGVLLTMLDSRTNLGIEVSQEVRKYFREKVYDVVIPRNIKLSPSLDVRDGRVVKGVNFQGLRDVSDPVALAEHYSRSGADELVFYAF